jgi:hypothetical protein
MQYARILLLFLLFLEPVYAVENRIVNCEPETRVTDEQAIRLAKSELGKRIKAFDAENYSFSVTEDGCDLRVTIEKKQETKIGRISAVVLSRGGAMKRYFGGM